MREDDLDARRRRAAYRAGHRGTKEMDWLLGRYSEVKLPGMSAVEIGRFERLLALPDPQLQRWILEPDPADAGEFEADISALRAFHGMARRQRD